MEPDYQAKLDEIMEALKNAETTAEVEIEMYKETTELTDENLAKPFEQIQAALKAINVSSSNERN